MTSGIKTEERNSLAQAFGDHALDPADCAAIVVDIQKSMYPLSDELERRYHFHEIAQRTADTLAELRRLGVKCYYLWTDDTQTPEMLVEMRKQFLSEKGIEPAKPDEPDFYVVQPVSGDEVVKKTEASGFEGSNIDELLSRDGKKVNFIFGFFADACAGGTGKSSVRNGYLTVMASDCIDKPSVPFDTNPAFGGAIVATGADICQSLKR